jgi:peptide chain release factor 1
MLKTKSVEDSIGEVNGKIRLLYQRYIDSSKRSQWGEKFISLCDEWQQLRWEIRDLGTIEIADNEDLAWRSIVDLEIATLESKISNLQQQINLLLLDIHPYQHRDIFLEIHALTGGDEASIWVEDLVRMYTQYGKFRGWTVELVSESNNYPYGLNRAILEIKGAFVGYFLQFEAGIHQVKRKSFIEYNSTKIHTSTAMVTVMPIVNEFEIDLRDLELITSPIYHPRRTNTIGVGLYHQPTGIRIICDRCSNQFKNKEMTIEIMRSKLYKLSIQDRANEDLNSSIVRTYDYKNNCAIDFSSGMTFPLSQILEGDLDLSFASQPNNRRII